MTRFVIAIHLFSCTPSALFRLLPLFSSIGLIKSTPTAVVAGARRFFLRVDFTQVGDDKAIAFSNITKVLFVG
jgi:hypothetical protein